MRDYNEDRKQRMLSTLQYDYRQHERAEYRATIAMAGMVCVLGAIVIAVMAYCVRPAARKPLADCTGCHQRIQAFSEYFRRAGSRSPQTMATAVLSTRNPALMAAVAKVETGGNPDVRNGGYKKRHHGAFQVNPRHWGRVSHDPVEQALQAEAIIQELTTTMPIKKALAAYGGDSSSRYARTVLAELEGVPR